MCAFWVSQASSPEVYSGIRIRCGCLRNCCVSLERRLWFSSFMVLATHRFVICVCWRSSASDTLSTVALKTVKVLAASIRHVCVCIHTGRTDYHLSYQLTLVNSCFGLLVKDLLQMLFLIFLRVLVQNEYIQMLFAVGANYSSSLGQP